jgi:hypothetical protein
MMGLNVVVGVAAERSMESVLRVLLGYTHHSADGGKRMVWHELSSGKSASQAHAAVMPVAGETMGVGFSGGVWSGEGWPVRRSPQAPPPSH